MKERKHKTATFKAKQEYLLSGKIRCGECGSKYAGNSRKASGKNPLYISYSCLKKNGSIKCKNPGIKRDVLEEMVLKQLSKTVFSDKVIPLIVEKYNDYAPSRNAEYITRKEGLERNISNIVNAVATTGSLALAEKLKELETEKQRLTEAILEAECEMAKLSVDKKRIKAAFYKAKQMLKSGTLNNRKAIVEKYVKEVVMYKDKIEIEYVISDTYTFKEEMPRDN